MKIYIDNDFKCYTSDHDGSLREFETPIFDGKCNAFVEGCRYIPSGESWKRSDGVMFTGEMVAPYKPYAELLAAQSQYESDQKELAAAYQEGVNSV